MIGNFSDLLKATGEQAEPQRLLFLFAKAEAKKNKKKNQTGTISPVMCVDKLPEELTSFSALVSEADNITPEWDFMFIGGLSGAGGKAPTTEAAEPHLNSMANDLVSGQDMSKYVIFNRKEDPVAVQTR